MLPWRTQVRVGDGRVQTQDRLLAIPGLYTCFRSGAGPQFLTAKKLGQDGNFSFQNYTQKASFTQSVGNALSEGLDSYWMRNTL